MTTHADTAYPVPVSGQARTTDDYEERMRAYLGSRGVPPQVIEAYIAIHRAEQARAWQPIETAPKDGRRILIATPTSPNGTPGRVQEAWMARAYEEDPHGFWMTPPGPTGRGYVILHDFPTHWMPLPPPPTKEASQP